MHKQTNKQTNKQKGPKLIFQEWFQTKSQCWKNCSLGIIRPWHLSDLSFINGTGTSSSFDTHMYKSLWWWWWWRWWRWWWWWWWRWWWRWCWRWCWCAAPLILICTSHCDDDNVGDTFSVSLIGELCKHRLILWHKKWELTRNKMRVVKILSKCVWWNLWQKQIRVVKILTKNKTLVALDSMATTWHWLTSGIDHSFPDGTTSPIVDWFRKNFISVFFLHFWQLSNCFR